MEGWIASLFLICACVRERPIRFVYVVDVDVLAGGEVRVGDVGVVRAGFLAGVAAARNSPHSRLHGDVGVVRAGFLRRVAAARISPRNRLHADVGVVRAGFLARVAATRISPRSRLHGCV